MSRKLPKVTELESTAFHEAGHAAAAFHLGVAVKEVSIVPDIGAERLGHCAGYGYPDWFSPDALIDDRSRALAEREIIVMFAGPAAEARARGRRDHVGAGGDDYRYAIDLASRFCGSIEETTAYVAWLALRAQNLIHDPFVWFGVEALAAALLARRTLTGRKARAAYRAGQDEFRRANGIGAVAGVAEKGGPSEAANGAGVASAESPAQTAGSPPARPNAAGRGKAKRGTGKARK
jgi:hypothetical protein